MKAEFSCAVKGTTVTLVVNRKPESFDAAYMDEREIREHLKWIGITAGVPLSDATLLEYLIMVLRDLGRVKP